MYQINLDVEPKRYIKLIALILLAACRQEGENPSPGEGFVFEPPPIFGDYEIPEDNPITKEGVVLGRMLFYEPMLSADNTISCGSCHRQSRAFADDKQFSAGIEGILGDRNTMALSNLLWEKRFFWDGRAASLEQQVLEPIQDHREMSQTLEQTIRKLNNSEIYPEKFEKAFGTAGITSGNLAKALAQFIRTMISSGSKLDKSMKGELQLSYDEEMGRVLFHTHPLPQIGLRGGNCGDCHLEGHGSTGGLPGEFGNFHNNGLDNDNNLKEGLKAVTGNTFDKGKFKVPPLRNIALTAPYMHDGRFQTLEEVLDHYNEHVQMSETLDPLVMEASNVYPIVFPVKLHLTEEEKRQIILFLHTLTDSTFIQDERFSNPFK